MSKITLTRSAVTGLVASLLALAIVITLHRVEPSGLSPLAGKLLRSLHGPGFVVIALVVCLGLRKRVSGWTRIILALAISGAISLLAELSQVPGPRNAEVADLLVDGLGIAAGVGFIAAIDSSLDFGASVWPRRALALASLVALVLISAPTAWLGAALVNQRTKLPVLLSFDSPLERELYAGMQTPKPVRVPAPAGWISDGSKIGHGTASGRWGTMLAMSPYPDWQAYEAVSFIAASGSDDPFDIGIMLRSDSENFYRRFSVKPEPQRVRVDFADIRAKRPDFDFSNVRTLVISAADPGDPLEVLLDDFRLEQ